MALTSIGDQRTPAVPIEITLDPELGLPSANQELCIIGHAASGMAASANYKAVSISNVADPVAAEAEAAALFGGSSAEIVKMIVAAVKANEGASTVPPIKAIPLQSTDADFGASDAALTTLKTLKAEFVVSPYDALSTALRTKIRDAASTMSGAQRPANNQYGTIAVLFNRSASSATGLDTPDSQYLSLVWGRDSGSPTYSVAESAAACAARMARGGVPFNSIDDENITGLAAPAAQSDWISVGAGLESEAALVKGWTPLRVKASGDVAFVRTVTSRVTNGVSSAAVTAYYDVQDFQVLYFFRKAVYTRLTQTDIKNTKASKETAKLIRGEVLRLAQLFEDQQMFQNVAQLAPQFKVERNISDRHRFDVLIPVNVIPNLHVIAVNVKAGTQFDTLVI